MEKEIKSDAAQPKLKDSPKPITRKQGTQSENPQRRSGHHKNTKLDNRGFAGPNWHHIIEGTSIISTNYE